MIALLSAQEINDRLPALLPEGTACAHKTGDLDHVVHDAGIVYSPYGPFIIVLMSSEVDDDPAPVFSAVTRVVWAHFSVPTRQSP